MNCDSVKLMIMLSLSIDLGNPILTDTNTGLRLKMKENNKTHPPQAAKRPYFPI